MKTTKYFTRIAYFSANLLESINEMISERDEFVRKNQDSIGEIDSEDITMHSGGPQNNAIIIVIKLIYYPKIEI